MTDDGCSEVTCPQHGPANIQKMIASMPNRELKFMAYSHDPENCPDGPHRGPQGPNEDLSQCYLCLMPSSTLRPAGETYGEHLADCSLPIDHSSYCVPGGAGHPDSAVVRGYFPLGVAPTTQGEQTGA